MKQIVTTLLAGLFISLSAFADSPIDYFAILEIPEKTPIREIPQAFSKMHAKLFMKFDGDRFNPDHFSKVPLADLVLLIEAYEVLSSNFMRPAYEKDGKKRSPRTLPSNIASAGERAIAIYLLAVAESERSALEIATYRAGSMLGHDFAFKESVILSRHVLDRFEGSESREICIQVRNEFARINEAKFFQSEPTARQILDFTEISADPQKRSAYLMKAWEKTKSRAEILAVMPEVVLVAHPMTPYTIARQALEKLNSDPARLLSVLLDFLLEKEMALSEVQRERLILPIADVLVDAGFETRLRRLIDNYLASDNLGGKQILDHINDCGESMAAAANL